MTTMVSPTGISLTEWIHSLTVNFPNDIIPVVTDESQWRFYGDIVANSPSFAQRSVPNTAQFDNWKEWAERLYGLFG